MLMVVSLGQKIVLKFMAITLHDMGCESLVLACVRVW